MRCRDVQDAIAIFDEEVARQTAIHAERVSAIDEAHALAHKRAISRYLEQMQICLDHRDLMLRRALKDTPADYTVAS